MVLYGLLAALALLFTATQFYPGGNQYDAHTTAWSWQHNYISNLFGKQGINGQPNHAQPWAIAAMLTLSLSMAVFFIQFAQKIPTKSASRMIQYFGAGGMLFTFLVVTPWHDAMITVAVTLTLVAIFYITVLTFKTKRHLLKLLCVLCMLIAYITDYVYYTQSNLLILPTLQKLTLLTIVGWALGMHYFTSKGDYENKLTTDR